MHRWENENVFVAFLPGFSTTGWRRDSSASQLSFGVGYNFNKNWGIEVLHSKIPDLIIPGSHWLIPPIEQDDEPVSASWVASKHDGDFRGVSVIYDHYLSERVSVFLKVGVGSIGAEKKLDSTLTDSHRVLLDEQIDDGVLLGGQRGCDGCSLRSGVKVYAVGMRMPLLHYTKVSITFAYQFVRKDIQYYRFRDSNDWACVSRDSAIRTGQNVDLRNRHPVAFVTLFCGRVVVSTCVERLVVRGPHR